MGNIGEVETPCPYLVVYPSKMDNQMVWIPCSNLKNVARYVNALNNHDIKPKVIHVTKNITLSQEKVDELRHAYLSAMNSSKKENRSKVELFFDQN